MEKSPIPFVLLDSTVLTNGIRVLVDGVDISQFEKNPVMFYLHDDWELPIGTWENVRKENGQLLADAVFDYEDTDPKVIRIIGKVERGIIKMASVGLVDLEASYDQVYITDKQDGPTVLKSRLREASIVPVGRNFNALRLFDKNGKELEYKDDPKLMLSDFIVSPKIEKTMTKKYLEILNLADNASPDQIDQAVEKLASEKSAAEAKVIQLSDDIAAKELERKEAAEKLSAIEAADIAAKKTAFELELADAFKDGRLSEKPEGDKATPVKDRMLNLFDKDAEGTMQLIKDLPKHKSAINLSDVDPQVETAFQKRKREIDEANKKKK